MLRFAIPVALLLAGTANATIDFTGSLAIAGGDTDLSGISPNFGGNRLSFGSDLFYDRSSSSFWGITDRGPGGGVIDFAPRVHQFTLDISSAGAVGGYTLLKTVVFKQADGVTPFTGLNPLLAPQGSKSVLGGSFDPEGFHRLANGNMLVSDEYGPSVYEFDSEGVLIRAFEVPANLVPRQADSSINYVDGRPTITSGRQDNRGYEGLTVSADGTKVYAILQDPLVNEGRGGQGRRSRNLRIVEYDMATGQQTAQYAYQLESIADINLRTTTAFQENQQGRNIGVSSITALPNGQFLVIERDNRGIGVDDGTGASSIGTKRVYLVSLAGATDVKDISFAGSSMLPGGVVPVAKSLYLDVYQALADAGITVGEKLEGLSFGPAIDGGLSLVLVTDNDFSVTQTGQGVQLDVCSSGVGGITSQVALGAACPNGQALLPTYAYVFKVSGDSLAAVVPEPATWGMMIAGFGLVGSALRRRRALAS